MPTILLLNGPNLNLLGTREPHLYGADTLPTIEARLRTLCAARGVHLDTLQSNHEGALIDRIHAARGGPAPDTAPRRADAIVINPGALTHTSIALRDALLGVGVPFVEVHITNVHAREGFRAQSYLADRAEAVVAGLGVYGYEAAVEFAVRGIVGRGAKL